MIKTQQSSKRTTTYGPRRMTFWMTRDRTQVGLSGSVDVWLVHPVRVLTSYGSYWKLPPGTDEVLLLPTGNVTAHLGTWSLDLCLREAHVYPDDDAMLIRVGPEPTLPENVS